MLNPVTLLDLLLESPVCQLVACIIVIKIFGACQGILKLTTVGETVKFQLIPVSAKNISDHKHTF